jgi:hypothetical protein
MNSDFISIQDLIHRDLKDKEFIKEQIVYQIQAEKDNTYAQIIPVGIYNKIPIKLILEIPINEYNCQLISFLITIDEIEKEEHLRLIGFLIYKNNKIVGSLDFIFKTNNKIVITDIIVNNKNDIKNIEGLFEIIFITGNSTQIIKTIRKYPGREESIYILTETLYSLDF